MSIVYTPEELHAYTYYMGLCDPQVLSSLTLEHR